MMFKSCGNNRFAVESLTVSVAEFVEADDIHRVVVPNGLLWTMRGIKALARPRDDPTMNRDMKRESKTFIECFNF